MDSGGPKEAQVQSYLPDGANVPLWEGTYAQPGEYDRTVCLLRQCGPMSNYFDHLFIYSCCSLEKLKMPLYFVAFFCVDFLLLIGHWELWH